MADSNESTEESIESGVAPEEVRSELDRIIKSGAIKSDRHKRFLSYIIEETLAGRGDYIKAYTVATEVFGRGDDFDSASDPIVRVEAGRLRRGLEHFYLTAGIDDPLLVTIPKGSYVPVFIYRKKEDQKRTVSEPNGEGSPNLDAQYEKRDLTIAIVPFENISGDQQLDYFGVGISEEIASRLSLYKNFVIVPPIATRHVRAGDSLFKLTDFAQEFNSRYVLDAIIRKAKDCIRVIVRLSDTSDKSQIWSGTYNIGINIEDLIRIEDEIATQVVNSIANEYGGVIPKKVSSEVESKESMKLSTYAAVLHIHHYVLSSTPAKIYKSTYEAVHQAFQNDPTNSNMLSSFALLKLDGYSHGWADTDELPVAECQELIDKALRYDKECDLAYFVWAALETNRRRKKELLDVVQELLMFKHSSLALVRAGWFLAIAGEYEEGIKLLDRHLGLLRYYPGYFQHAYFLYHYEHGRYEEALAHANQNKMPGILWDPIERAAVLGQLGRLDDGRNAIQELLTLYPNFFQNPRRYLNCYIMCDDLVDKVLDGVKKIGFSESSEK